MTENAKKFHSDAERVGWIGVDFDGVLVEWDPKYLPDCGPPIVHGITLVRRLKAEGHEIRIFTARIQPSPDEQAWWDEANRLGFKTVEDWVKYQHQLVENFCIKHFGAPFKITACKDWRMITCYDDRCVQMVPNTGESLDERYKRNLSNFVDWIREILQWP